MLLERHTAPLVNVSLAVDAGYAADSPEKAGAASLALDLLDDGTTTRDTFAIADELDALGAASRPAARSICRSCGCRRCRATCGPSLDALRRRRAAPVVPAGHGRAGEAAAAGADRPGEGDAHARRPCASCRRCSTAPATPTATRSAARASSARCRRSRATIWWRGIATGSIPRNATLIVTGDTTMAAVLPELERAFGVVDGRDRRPPSACSPCRATAGKRVYLIDRPGAPQSVIVAAHVSEPGGQPEDLAIDTVMRNFGGIATSRLNRNLRLDKHWSYGTQGVLQDARGQRPFIVHRAGADRQDEGVDRRGDEGASRRRRRAADPRRGVRQHHADADARAARPVGDAGVARGRGDPDRQLRLSGRLLLDLRARGCARSASRTWQPRRRSSSTPNARSG